MANNTYQKAVRHKKQFQGPKALVVSHLTKAHFPVAPEDYTIFWHLFEKSFHLESELPPEDAPPTISKELLRDQYQKPGNKVCW